MEPLFDLRGRIVAIGTGATTSAVVDALFRMQAAKQRSRPITVYMVGATVESTPLLAGDALLLADVIRSIASPVRTVGFGMLTGWQPLLLACGSPGERFLLTRSLVALGPLDWNGLALPKNPIGLQPQASPQPSSAIRQQLHGQLQRLLTELNLESDLFADHRLLNADEAIASRLADRVFQPALKPENSPQLIARPALNYESQP